MNNVNTTNDLEFESGFIDYFGNESIDLLESGSGDDIDDSFGITLNRLNGTNISLSNITNLHDTHPKEYDINPALVVLVVLSPCISCIGYFVVKFILSLLYSLVIAITELKNKLSNKIKEYYTNKPIKNKKLSNKFIKSLNINNKDSCIETSECGICLNEISENKNNLIYLDCKHVFHKKCLQPWVKNKLENIEKPNCPMCRHTIVNIPDVKPQLVFNYGYTTYSDSDSDYSYSDY